MQSDAGTVEEYLDGLPPDRREALETVRRVILDNLPEGYEETMAGMIYYQVPLSVYSLPKTGQPQMYAALASQKRHLSLYVTNVHGTTDQRDRLAAGFAAEGKRLDMGKSCIRFRRVDDLALEPIGELIASMPMEELVAVVEAGQGT